MSTFNARFAEVAAPLHVEQLGEAVVFDPGVGQRRLIMMELERDVQGVDSVGSPVYSTIGRCCPCATSIDDDGHGGIDPNEIVYGRAIIEYPLRVGAAVSTPKMIRRIVDDGSGMTVVEVS